LTPLLHTFGSLICSLFCVGLVELCALVDICTFALVGCLGLNLPLLWFTLGWTLAPFGPSWTLLGYTLDVLVWTLDCLTLGWDLPFGTWFALALVGSIWTPFIWDIHLPLFGPVVFVVAIYLSFPLVGYYLDQDTYPFDIALPLWFIPCPGLLGQPHLAFTHICGLYPSWLPSLLGLVGFLVAITLGPLYLDLPLVLALRGYLV